MAIYRETKFNNLELVEDEKQYHNLYNKYNKLIDWDQHIDPFLKHGSTLYDPDDSDRIMGNNFNTGQIYLFDRHNNVVVGFSGLFEDRKDPEDVRKFIGIDYIIVNADVDQHISMADQYNKDYFLI